MEGMRDKGSSLLSNSYPNFLAGISRYRMAIHSFLRKQTNGMKATKENIEDRDNTFTTSLILEYRKLLI